MPIVAIMNQKGGSGKTTTAVNLAAALASRTTVLVVDLDPQAHASVHLGVVPEQDSSSTYEFLFSDSTSLPRTVAENLDAIPSSIRLSAAELELFSRLGREHILRSRLAPLKDRYDYILIDCPPALGMLTINALCAASHLLVPVSAEFLPLEGLTQLLRTAELVRTTFSNPLEILGVLLTRYDARQTICREIRDRLLEWSASGDALPVFETAIRENVRLKEAPSHGQSIFDYAPTSYGAEDYESLAKEIAK